jgi:glycine dehydrogenase
MPTTTAPTSAAKGSAEKNSTSPTVDPAILNPSDTFWHRHIAPSAADQAAMLATLGFKSLDDLTNATVPAAIRLNRPLNIDASGAGRLLGESECVTMLKGIASQNKVFKSYIGMGYYDTITPGVILRNILENPGWYTQYTPYQAEISQGRLEALLNFQTMVADLTGLPLAGASLLDEGDRGGGSHGDVLRRRGRRARATRRRSSSRRLPPADDRGVPDPGESLGIEIRDRRACQGRLVQERPVRRARAVPEHQRRDQGLSRRSASRRKAGALVVAATDLLALTLITPPGEWGADIAVGSAQRFGVPMGFGGPHAAFISTSDKYVRKMPGRIIGVSKDSHGNVAYRMAIQTREQHIRREKGDEQHLHRPGAPGDHGRHVRLRITGPRPEADRDARRRSRRSLSGSIEVRWDTRCSHRLRSTRSGCGPGRSTRKNDARPSSGAAEPRG